MVNFRAFNETFPFYLKDLAQGYKRGECLCMSSSEK